MSFGRATAIFCALALASAQQPVTPEFSPDARHTLQYGVEWRLIRAGVARVTWAPSLPSGYQADLHLESAGMVSKLYRVNDDYKAILTSGLCINNILFNAEEGKRRRETKISSDGKGKISYLERDLTRGNVVLSKELSTPPCVFEYMGALSKLRSMRLAPGSSAQIPLTDGKKFAEVKVEAQEREQVKTPAGSFNAIRHEIYMFNDVIIPRKARMFIWLTDDARRLPVQLRVRLQFLIGTITLQLEKQEQ